MRIRNENNDNNNEKKEPFEGTYRISEEMSGGQPVYIKIQEGKFGQHIKAYALLYDTDRWKITYFGYRKTDHFLACLKCPPGTTCYGHAAKPYVWLLVSKDPNDVSNVVILSADNMMVEY